MKDVTDTIEASSQIIVEASLPDHVVDRENLYITCGMNDRRRSTTSSSSTAASFFLESRLWIMNKTALYGTNTTQNQYPDVIPIDGSIYGVIAKRSSKTATTRSSLGAATTSSSTRQAGTTINLRRDVLTSVTSLVVPGEDNNGPYSLGYMTDYALFNTTDFGVYCVSYGSNPEDENSATSSDEDDTDIIAGTEYAHVFLVTNVTGGNTIPLLTNYTVNLGEVEDTLRPLPLAEQPGSSGDDPFYPRLDTGERRVMDAVWYQNFLWFVTPIRLTRPGTRTAIYWAKIRAPRGPTALLKIDPTKAVVKSGNVNGTDIVVQRDDRTISYAYNPSIAINACDRVGIGFSLSAEGLYAGAYVVFMSDRTEDSFGNTTTLAEGLASYETYDGRGDWSIYSGISVDFDTKNCIWVYNQFAAEPIRRNTDNSNAFLEAWSTEYGVICSCQEGYVPPTRSPTKSPTKKPTMEPSRRPTKRRKFLRKKRTVPLSSTSLISMFVPIYCLIYSCFLFFFLVLFPIWNFFCLSSLSFLFFG